ncbi:MAG: UDP-N-acetylglucosamine 2-epimerase [Vicinamibacterales bacterium]
MRSIAAVSVSRADYGILRPVLRAIQSAPELQLHLVVAGTHLPDAPNSTSGAIAADGFQPAASVPTLPGDDTPLGVARATGRALTGFAEVLESLRPDLVMLVGDRFETLAAAGASALLGLPIGHLHGGELTEGAIDDQIRHAITKMSHLHFVASAPQARRVIQMGEEPWRVTVSGAAGLDIVTSIRWWDTAQIEQAIGLALPEAPLLVTYHPVTLDQGAAAAHVDELIAALDTEARPIIVTAPNVDAGNIVVRARLEAWVRRRPNAAFVENLGVEGYWSVMAVAAAMVGNSSSGIIEAASVRLPVVDVGDRQAGRDRAANVVHVGNTREEIRSGIDAATSPAFRAGLSGLVNPYGDGHAAERIVRVLRETSADRRLLTKRFHHVDPAHHQAD